MRQAVTQAHDVRWDERLYPGLAVAAVPGEVRAALAQALGALGVEAEHFLQLVASFTRGGPAGPTTRAAGEAFLWQLDASARRMAADAESFELAAQSYLAALESAAPEVRASRPADGGTLADQAEPWWSASDATSPMGEPLELALRRCGYAYRHVVAAHLAAHVEAIGEYLALLLHALRTLPPAGVLPLPTLYAGLYELTATFQGHLVPHHLSDLSPDRPGLISGIALLRQLDATEDRSIAADLTWARGQLAEVERTAANLPASATAQPRPSAWQGLTGLFRREPANGASRPVTPRAWAEDAQREWRATIGALETLRAAPPARTPPRPR
jgi:hypothetical protein